MTTLITGGTGFVGSNLDGDIRVSSQDADLRDFDKAKALFNEIHPEVIIHAAAKHGNFAQIADNKVGYYRDNALININVFEAARLAGVKNIMAFSSVTAFPDHISSFSEEDLYKGEPHDSCYPYAYAKRMIEVLCRAYLEQYELNYNCIFLANAYGPGGRDNVIPLLIRKCLEAKKHQTSFEILGDGTPRRDFIFIRDVREIVKLLKPVRCFGPVTFSSGTSVSIRELVDEIVRAVDFRGQIVWNDQGDVGQKEKVPSNHKLMKILPDFSFTPLREGIEKTVGWTQKAYESFTKI
jgi:GDP-L-fucose synthase